MRPEPFEENLRSAGVVKKRGALGSALAEGAWPLVDGAGNGMARPEVDGVAASGAVVAWRREKGAVRAHDEGADCEEPEVDVSDEEDGASASLGSWKSRLGVI